MKTRTQIKEKLYNDLLIFESDLTRLTEKEHKKCMKYVHKLFKLVEKFYRPLH